MKQILGGRASGKTHQMMQMYFENKRNNVSVKVIVHGAAYRDSLIKQYSGEWNPDRELLDKNDFLIAFSARDNLRGSNPQSKLLIDNLDLMFRDLFGQNPEAYTLNVRPGSIEGSG